MFLNFLKKKKKSKLNLDILFNFWDIYIIENDKLMILYFSLALIIYHKRAILEADLSSLPQTIAELKIDTLD